MVQVSVLMKVFVFSSDCGKGRRKNAAGCKCLKHKRGAGKK